MSTNLEVKYIFLSWGGFIERLIQMFKDLEATTTAKKKALKPYAMILSY